MSSRTVLTPPLNAKGLFTVAAPFTLVANTLYTVKAIRSFADLIEDGIDVKATYYTANSLTDQDYTDDLNAGANIITLMSSSQPSVHLPDTFITTFPDMGDVAYSTVIMAVSVGPLPDSLDLTAATQAIASAVSDLIGLEPTVDVFTVPSTSVVTQEQADAAETARQAAITTRTTDHAKVVSLQAAYDDLMARYQDLEAIIIANNLATTQ